MGKEVEKAAKAAFLQLKPICSAAANIPNLQNFTNLLNALEDVEVSSSLKGKKQLTESWV